MSKVSWFVQHGENKTEERSWRPIASSLKKVVGSHWFEQQHVPREWHEFVSRKVHFGYLVKVIHCEDVQALEQAPQHGGHGPKLARFQGNYSLPYSAYFFFLFLSLIMLKIKCQMWRWGTKINKKKKVVHCTEIK